MRVLKRSKKFKKDFKKVHGHKDFNEKTFFAVMECIQNNTPLPHIYKDHKLHGEFADCRECHIGHDILLIYSVREDEKVVYLLRIGSHSDLF